MREFMKLVESLTNATYTRDQLEQMDIDDLDMMAFGHYDGEEVMIDPNDIKIKWHDDLGNPEHKFAKGGMDWVHSVDFSGPVELSVNNNGEIELEDGHHRWFAAKKLGRKLKGVIEIKGKPIERILAQQSQIVREWAEPDHLISDALSLTMRMCKAHGLGKGDEAEFSQWCEQRLRDAYAEIASHIRGDDTLTIYRAITLPDGEVPDTNRYPGIYWTFDKDAIHPAHGHMGQRVWVFTAETNVDQIDWVWTLAQNVAPGYEAEKEIRLKDYGQIEDLSVTDTGEVK